MGYLLLGMLLGGLMGALVSYYALKQLTETIKRQRQQQVRPFRLFTGLFGPGFNAFIRELNLLLEDEENKRQALLEEQSRLQEDLSNLSHDLRTPLTAIYGYLSLAIKKPDDQTMDRYLQTALSRLETLQTLIDNLFYLTRLEHQAVKLHWEEVYLHNLITEQLLDLYLLLEQRGIQLQLDFPDSFQAVRLRSDYAALERLLMNLFQNMAKYTPENEKATITAYETPKGWVLELINPVLEGQALNVEKIFARYYMANQSRNNNSSGLGLAICQKLSEQLGLTLTISLEKNTFKVCLKFFAS